MTAGASPIADPTIPTVDTDSNSELAYSDAMNYNPEDDNDEDQTESYYRDDSNNSSNILNLFSLGITSNYDISGIFGVKSSETEDTKIVLDDYASRTDFNVCFELNTPVLTLAYTIQNNKIGERDFNLRYSSYALDFINIGVTYDMEVFSAAYLLPRFAYSTGDNRDFSFRGLNMQLGFLEMTNEHRVFWDQNDKSLSFTHSTARYTLVGLKGLMDRMAEVNFYQSLNDASGSFVNNAATESLGMPVLPYCSLLLQEDKYTSRRFDKILDENKTEYKFGWDFGASVIYNMCYQTSYTNLAAVLRAAVGIRNYSTEVGYRSGLYFELSIKAGLFFKNNKR